MTIEEHMTKLSRSAFNYKVAVKKYQEEYNQGTVDNAVNARTEASRMVLIRDAAFVLAGLLDAHMEYNDTDFLGEQDVEIMPSELRGLSGQAEELAQSIEDDRAN